MIKMPTLDTTGTEEDLAARERAEIDEVWRLLVKSGIPGSQVAEIAVHVLSAVAYGGLRHSRGALSEAQKITKASIDEARLAIRDELAKDMPKELANVAVGLTPWGNSR